MRGAKGCWIHWTSSTWSAECDWIMDISCWSVDCLDKILMTKITSRLRLRQKVERRNVWKWVVDSVESFHHHWRNSKCCTQKLLRLNFHFWSAMDLAVSFLLYAIQGVEWRRMSSVCLWNLPQMSLNRCYGSCDEKECAALVLAIKHTISDIFVKDSACFAYQYPCYYTYGDAILECTVLLFLDLVYFDENR